MTSQNPLEQKSLAMREAAHHIDSAVALLETAAQRFSETRGTAKYFDSLRKEAVKLWVLANKLHGEDERSFPLRWRDRNDGYPFTDAKANLTPADIARLREVINQAEEMQ